jgi:gluconolactonase
VTDWRLLTDGLDFPEGPTFDRDGQLLVVEVAAGRITAIGDDGNKRTHATPGGGPNGLVLGSDGAVYCANNGGFEWDGDTPKFDGHEGHGRIERVSPDGEVEELYRACGDITLNAPDDITVDREGRLWFTDPGHGDFKETRGRVYAAAPDGSEIHEVARDYQFPNGIAFTPDYASLVVAETGSGWLWIHPVLDGARLGDRRELVRLPRGFKPDGLCLDEEGSMIVAGTFGGGVFAYTAGGELIEEHRFEDPYVTNMAFGGPDFDEVFVTLGKTGEVRVMQWMRRGLRLPFDPEVRA